MNTINFRILFGSVVAFLAILDASNHVQCRLKPSPPFSFINVFKRAISAPSNGAGGGRSGSGAYGLDYAGSYDSYDPSINYLYSFNETYPFHNKHTAPKFRPKHAKNRQPGGSGQENSYSESDLINFSSGDHERSLSNLFNVNSQRPYDSIYESNGYDHTNLNYNSSFLTQNIDFGLFFNKSRPTLNNLSPSPNANESLDSIVASLIAKIVLAIFYIFICVSCVLGNILVILSVFTYKPLQSVQNIFIVSLAVADTFVAIFVMPFHIIFHIKDGEWIFGAVLCHFFITLDILLCTASILMLCCIALDRYWAIKDSIKYAQKRTMKRVLFMILIAWLSSAFISLPGIFWNYKTIGLFPITPPAEPQEVESSPLAAVSRSVRSNASASLLRDAFGLSSSTTTKMAPTSNDEPYDRLKYHFVCDISRDISYRIYSSCGTFYIPLLIMTFVYVRIYLETKRRLHERAKAAKKLANSIAQHNKNAVVPEKSFIKKCASRYLLCGCLRKKDTLEGRSICGDVSKSSNHKQVSPNEEAVIMMDNDTGMLNSDSLIDENRRSISRVGPSSSSSRRLQSRNNILSIDEEEPPSGTLSQGHLSRGPIESLSLNRSNDGVDETTDMALVSPKSIQSSGLNSTSSRCLKSAFNEFKKKSSNEMLSADDSLTAKYKNSLTPSIAHQHCSKLPSDDNISQDPSSVSFDNENDSDSLKLNDMNNNLASTEVKPGLKAAIKKPNTGSSNRRRDPKNVTMKAFNVLQTELLRGDDIIKPANSEIKRVSIGTNTVGSPGVKLRSQISIDGTIASLNEPSSPADMNRLMSTTLSINNPTATTLSPSATQWLRTSANTGVTLKQRQKISLTRERRAARTLGIIMGSFTLCWCPFFIVYILQALGFEFSEGLSTFLTWLGYVNSALNPVIYTIFNLDFRKSFKRLLFGCTLCKRR